MVLKLVITCAALIALGASPARADAPCSGGVKPAHKRGRLLPARIKAWWAQRQTRPARQRLGQRLRPFKRTDIVVSVGLGYGPPGTVGVEGSASLVLRGRESKQLQGCFLTTGVHAGPVGVKKIWSFTRELRGWEGNLGPLANKHPVLGDRASTAIVPGVLGISAAKEGGLGLKVCLPLPRTNYLLARVPVEIYIGNPRLKRASQKVHHGIHAVGDRLRKPLDRYVVKPVTRASAPLRASLQPRLRQLGQRLRRNPRKPAP